MLMVIWTVHLMFSSGQILLLWIAHLLHQCDERVQWWIFCALTVFSVRLSSRSANRAWVGSDLSAAIHFSISLGGLYFVVDEELSSSQWRTLHLLSVSSAMDYFDRVELSGCSSVLISSPSGLFVELSINDIEWLLFNYSLHLLLSAEENRSVGRSDVSIGDIRLPVSSQ